MSTIIKTDKLDSPLPHPSGAQDASYVKRAFAGIAPRYVLANHVLSGGIDLWWRRKTASLVASFSPGKILDVATGSGDLAAAIQKACPEAKVLGVDFSVPMMKQAQARGLRALMAADGLRLPFRDHSFDVVTVAFGLRNMASWKGALEEMRRIINPGGHVVILDFSTPSSPILGSIHRTYLKHVMPLVAGTLTGERHAYEYLCSSIERFPCGREMEDLIASCGFVGAASQPLTFGVATLYSAQRPATGKCP